MGYSVIVVYGRPDESGGRGGFAFHAATHWVGSGGLILVATKFSFTLFAVVAFQDAVAMRPAVPVRVKVGLPGIVIKGCPASCIVFVVGWGGVVSVCAVAAQFFDEEQICVE